tara:strand:- start:2628 stop:3236 length:609 start_codon:yes stop_codon:yes gene_type:complete
MAIVTASQVRDYIPTLTGDGDDTLLNTLVSRFNAVAAAYMGYPKQSSGAVSLESGTYIEHIDGPGGRDLTLTVKPVSSITSIYDDPDLDYTDSADLIAASDYTLYSHEGRVVLDYNATDASWSTGYRHIKATYVGGYTGANMPKAIQHAACLQVAHWYAGRSHIGRTNLSSQGQTVALKTLELLPEVRMALQPYRLATVWVG